MVRREGATALDADREAGASVVQIKHLPKVIDAASAPTRSDWLAASVMLDAHRELVFAVTKRLAERVESLGDQMKSSEVKQIQKKSAEVIAMLSREGHTDRTRPIRNAFYARLRTFQTAMAKGRFEEANKS